jgi:hypothetical protein
MADLAESEDAAHGIDDVVRRPAPRLIDDQGAVERRGLSFLGMSDGLTSLSAFRREA